MPWNPDKYHQFQIQRSTPFDDLIKLVEVRPNLRVVDLGCGTGSNFVFLAKKGFDVTGVDFASSAIDKAKEKARIEGVKINFVEDDITNLHKY